MRKILAGLTLAGVLTLSTLTAFAGDTSTKDFPSLPNDQAPAFALVQPQQDAAGAAGSTEVAPSPWIREHYDTRD